MAKPGCVAVLVGEVGQIRGDVRQPFREAGGHEPGERRITVEQCVAVGGESEPRRLGGLDRRAVAVPSSSDISPITAPG